MSQLEDILDTVAQRGYAHNDEVTKGFKIKDGGLEFVKSQAAQQILDLCLECAPEERTASMVMGCPYCKRSFPVIEEEYNKAITEVNERLKEALGVRDE